MKTFLKPLTPEEEKRYLQEYKQGSPEAKDILIQRNLRLVAHIVKKYQGAAEELDDLISIGTIGLIKAIQTFDFQKASRLSTYAARCIDNAILSPMRFYSRRESPVREFSHAGGYFQNFLMKTISCAEQWTALYSTLLCVSIHSG